MGQPTRNGNRDCGPEKPFGRDGTADAGAGIGIAARCRVGCPISVPSLAFPKPGSKSPDWVTHRPAHRSSGGGALPAGAAARFRVDCRRVPGVGPGPRASAGPGPFGFVLSLEQGQAACVASGRPRRGRRSRAPLEAFERGSRAGPQPRPVAPARSPGPQPRRPTVDCTLSLGRNEVAGRGRCYATAREPSSNSTGHHRPLRAVRRLWLTGCQIGVTVVTRRGPPAKRPVGRRPSLPGPRAVSSPPAHGPLVGTAYRPSVGSGAVAPDRPRAASPQPAQCSRAVGSPAAPGLPSPSRSMRRCCGAPGRSNPGPPWRSQSWCPRGVSFHTWPSA